MEHLIVRALDCASDFHRDHPRLWDAICTVIALAALLAAFHLEWLTGHPAHY